MDEQTFKGTSLPGSEVVRVGDTVRRPRDAGSEVVEALLVHLERVGFDPAPRFLGVDDEGRQILSFVDGAAVASPPWQQDDRENAVALGRIAALLRELHAATADFSPPGGAMPRRPLPVAGDVWTHGDVGYGNVVHRARLPICLIDWEFAAPGHRCIDPAALLAVSVRGPRPDVDDLERRERAVELAVESIADAFAMDDDEVTALPRLAAAVLDDMVVFLGSSMSREERGRATWRADWFRTLAENS